MTTPLKRCTGCGETKPATLEYFNRKTDARDGLHPYCRACRTAAMRRYYASIPKPPSDPSIKQCAKCGNEYPATHEHFHRSKQTLSGLHPYCKPCANQVRKEYYLRNRDKVIAHQREYDQAHLVEKSERHREWRERNKEKRREDNRKWREQNQDYVRVTNREYARGWRAIHKDKINLRLRLRHHALRASGTITGKDVECQYQQQNGCCYWCSQSVGGRYHLDHVIPVAKGGENIPSNVVVSCPRCNWSKRDRLPFTEWTPPKPLVPPS